MANDLLDQAVEKYNIPPWPYECAFDRLIVFSVPEASASRDTYIEGGVIKKPDTVKAKQENTTPRGIIVSAGLGARDYLKGHGIGLGHMVWVARLSPWRHVVDKDKDGKDVEFLFLRAGDIVGSETLQEYMRTGAVTIEQDAEGEHRFKWTNGDLAPRFDPPSYVG